MSEDQSEVLPHFNQSTPMVFSPPSFPFIGLLGKCGVNFRVKLMASRMPKGV